MRYSNNSVIRTVKPLGLNKRDFLKFPEGYQLQLKTPDEGQRVEQPKYEYNNQNKYSWKISTNKQYLHHKNETGLVIY